jgi:hypothetical protein
MRIATGMLVLLIVSGCDSTGEECTTGTIADFTTAANGPTTTCGPEAVDETVDVVPGASGVTLTYHTIIMVCGGTIFLDATREGSRITIDERVEGGGECGCFTHTTVTVELELCEPGTYTVVVDDREQTVTI